MKLREKSGFWLCYLIVLVIELAKAQQNQPRSNSVNCPSVCRCYANSIVCSRRLLSSIPQLSGDAETLDLSNNQIGSIRNNEFSKVTSLKTLYLNTNDLRSLNQDTFAGLDQLRELSLHGNKIDRIDARAFSHLRSLRKLYLQTNKLKKIEPGTFQGLYYLEKLFLNDNMLFKLNEDSFDSSSKNSLKELNLAGNRLECDCDLFWLWKASEVTTSSQVRPTRLDLNANCYYPTHLQGRRLHLLTKSDFRCIEPMIVQAPRDVETSIDELSSFNGRTLFECQAVGHPTPMIEWFKNGRKIEGSKFTLANGGSNLIVRNLDSSDAGTFECVAKSSAGEARALGYFTIRDPYEFDNENQNLNDDDPEPPRDSEQQGSNDLVEFDEMPNDLVLNEGQNAKFQCRSNVRSSRINWLKDGEPLSRNTRFQVQASGELEIKSVRVEDEGFYVCSVTYLGTTKYAQALLEVNVPVSFVKTPSDQEAAEGNSVEFYCSVRGKPDPTIAWTKNGLGKMLKNMENDSRSVPHYEFYQSNQILRINGVSRSVDEGVYSCEANNSVNRVVSNGRLSVSRSVTPYFTIRQQNISVFEDHPITLECFANGDPKPQVLWYKNGQRIITDSRVYFDSFGYLVITQVRVSDAGEYLCRAENVAGFATHNFLVSVKDIYGSIISQSVIKDAIEEARNDIKKQFQNTLNNLNNKRRPKSMADLLALLRFPKDKTLNLVLSEEIYERALDIIFRYANNITFNLTNKEDFITQEVLTFRQLQRISDLSGCHRYKRKVECSKRCLNYRTFDGTCNQLQSPRRGAANTALRRLLPAEYQNGFSTPRGWNKSQLYHGFMLPSARDVSTRIISTKKITEDSRFSLMLMQWGQFLDHDLDHTVMALSLNRFSNGIACKDSCINDQPCFPIEVRENDTLRAHLPGKCMEFVRSSAVCGSGETSLLLNTNFQTPGQPAPRIHQREQINQLTAYIDASNVYGSNDQDAFDIRERTPNNGKLKVHVTPRYPKGLLPFNLDTNMDCQRDNTTTVGCFMAGDYRANEQLALLAMHNLWVRQHNTIVDNLKRVNEHWLPEQLYQEARKIVGAQMQIITYETWLPYILGPKGMAMLGKWKNYDDSVDPTISNEFATAAFRFGHALIQPFTFRLNASFQPIPEGNLQLRDSFFAPQRYYHEGGIDPLMRGLYGMPAKIKMPREIMNSELTEKLFHITRIISQDLAALNIQRGRDHGLPGYTAYRRFCNMSDVRDFEDLRNEISSKEVRDLLKKLYGDVRNIDIWPGGILEDVVEGSKLGPLFMCIIVNQFKVLRDGDRFWYEKPGVFTTAQLAELRKTSLAKIICENGDNIEHIQRDVFLNARFPRDMLRCNEIRAVSYEPWRNCCRENPTGLCGEPAYFYVPIDST